MIDDNEYFKISHYVDTLIVIQNDSKNSLTESQFIKMSFISFSTNLFQVSFGLDLFPVGIHLIATLRIEFGCILYIHVQFTAISLTFYIISCTLGVS